MKAGGAVNRVLADFQAAGARSPDELDLLARARLVAPQFLQGGASRIDASWEQSPVVRSYLARSVERTLATADDAMLQGLVDGQSDVVALAELAKGRLRSKRAELEQALIGTLEPHHAFMISQHLALLDVFDEQIAAFDDRISVAVEGTRPEQPPPDGQAGPEKRTSEGAEAAPSAPAGAWAAQAIVDAIPGIGSRIAETIVAELGTDMSRFPSAAHAASWAGLAPGQHESAGKRKSTRIRDGNRYLRAALTQASWAAVKQADTFLAAFYRRLAARRGKKKAIVAVAHKILVIVYTLLSTGQVYQERGAAALDERQKDRIVHRLERRIAQLGYKVHLEPVTAVAA